MVGMAREDAEVNESERDPINGRVSNDARESQADEQTNAQTPSKVYAVDEALDSMGFGLFQALMLAYTGVAWMGDGMEMLVLSFLGPSSHCEWGVSPSEQSALSSAVFFGMMLGAPLWGAVADNHGRKYAFFATAFATFAFGVASALAPMYWALLLARALVGFGLGGVPIAFSLFLEFLPSEGRGKWGVVIELFWTFGSITEAGLAWAILPHYSWRVLVVASATPLLLLISAYPIIPESAHFLSSKGRVNEATRVLVRIATFNRKELPYGKLLPAKTEDSGFKLRDVKKLLRKDRRTTTSLVWTIFFGVAFSYYGLVLLATELQLVSEGPDSNKCEPHSAAVMSTDGYFSIFLTAIAEIPGLLLAGILVDTIGRKKSLMVLMLTCSVCFFLLCVDREIAGKEALQAFQFAARATAMGSFTLSYVYVAEVYPTSLRSLGTGFANSFARIGGMLAPLCAVELLEFNEKRAALITFGVCAVAVAGCALALPYETMGKSMGDDAEEEEESVAQQHKENIEGTSLQGIEMQERKRTNGATMDGHQI